MTQKRKKNPAGNRPWSKRAKELQKKEGHYSGFAAWEEWFLLEDMHGLIDDMTTQDRIALYDIFCKCTDWKGVR